ncbi:MAG: hypothetical protein H6651_15010 [Ardenticatenales bacterium]|nr:hypothetical protein [Ardenticatenales bacterium]
MLAKFKYPALAALLFLTILFAACTAELTTVTSVPEATEPPNSEEPTEEPTAEPPAEAPTAYPVDEAGNLYVNSVDVLLMESFPLQAQAVVTGDLANGCIVLNGLTAVRDGDSWRIEFDLTHQGEMCTEALVPFEENVALDILGVPAGTYTVSAGDVSTEFTLAMDNGPIDEESSAVITLERTPCFGFCPTYTLAIFADGTVRYNGLNHVDVMGEQTGQISPEQVQALIDAFQAINYFDLQDEYTDLYVSDMPYTITSLTLDGQTKQINRYGGDGSAPMALLELENLIDTTVNSEQWTGSPPPEPILIEKPEG